MKKSAYLMKTSLKMLNLNKRYMRKSLYLRNDNSQSSDVSMSGFMEVVTSVRSTILKDNFIF